MTMTGGAHTVPVERGVLAGLILVASNPLNASSMLGAPGSSQAQSVGLLNGVNSTCHGALTIETCNIFVQRRELICRNNELPFLMDGELAFAFLVGTGFVQLTKLTGFEVGCLHRDALLVGTRPMQPTELTGFDGGHLHGRALLAGTGSVQCTVPVGFIIDLHGHTLLGGPRSVLCTGVRYLRALEPTSLLASTTRGGDRATAATTNEPMVWCLNRIVRIVESAARARANILAGIHYLLHPLYLICSDASAMHAEHNIFAYFCVWCSCLWPWVARW